MYHEIYGKYFNIIKYLLNHAPLTEKEINDYIIKNGFDESIIYLNANILVNDYKLFKKINNLYYPVTKNIIPNIMTFEQEEWIKLILKENLIRLFINEDTIKNIDNQLNIDKTYDLKNYRYIYQDIDKDEINTKIIYAYRTFNKAINNKNDLDITFISAKGYKTHKIVNPYKFEYSVQDGKIRLICIEYKNNIPNRLIKIKLASIIKWQLIERLESVDYDYYINKEKVKEPLIIEVYPSLNGIERVFIELSNYKREAYFDKERNISIMKIYYEQSDIYDLVLKLLSFGKVVKIISNGYIKDELIRRLKKQNEYIFKS